MGPRTQHVNNSSQGLNVPEIRAAIDPEIVTIGELDSLLLTARNVLEIDSLETTVNGIPALVSKSSAPVTVDGEQFFARVWKPKDKDDEDTLPGIVLDLTSDDDEVITPNPRAIYFTQTGGEHTHLIVDGDLEPIVDNPDLVEAIRGTLLAIHQTARTNAINRTVAQETRMRHAEELERQAKQERKLARHKVAASVGRAAMTVFKWSVVGVGVVGVVIGATRIDWNGTAFDEHGYSLDGGTELILGGHGAPEFSDELYGNPHLEPQDIPDIYGEDSDSDPSSLEMDDTLREVILTSSEDDKNCTIAPVDHVPSGTRLVAWTDSRNPDGTSRADEFDVLWQTDQVKVCWNGQEANDEDDPRVVVAFRPESESQPR